MLKKQSGSVLIEWMLSLTLIGIILSAFSATIMQATKTLSNSQGDQNLQSYFNLMRHGFLNMNEANISSCKNFILNNFNINQLPSANSNNPIAVSATNPQMSFPYSNSRYPKVPGSNRICQVALKPLDKSLNGEQNPNWSQELWVLQFTLVSDTQDPTGATDGTLACTNLQNPTYYNLPITMVLDASRSLLACSPMSISDHFVMDYSNQSSGTGVTGVINSSFSCSDSASCMDNLLTAWPKLSLNGSALQLQTVRKPKLSVAPTSSTDKAYLVISDSSHMVVNPDPDPAGYGYPNDSAQLLQQSNWQGAQAGSYDWLKLFTNCDGVNNSSVTIVSVTGVPFYIYCRDGHAKVDIRSLTSSGSLYTQNNLLPNPPNCSNISDCGDMRHPCNSLGSGILTMLNGNYTYNFQLIIPDSASKAAPYTIIFYAPDNGQQINLMNLPSAPMNIDSYWLDASGQIRGCNSRNPDILLNYTVSSQQQVYTIPVDANKNVPCLVQNSSADPLGWSSGNGPGFQGACYLRQRYQVTVKLPP